MLYCPNYTCQTPNSEAHKFCQKCRTPLPKHYLWAVGDDVAMYRSGDTLVDRYLCKSSRIFLDTKPGLYPTVPTEIPPEFVAYLRLSPYRLHVPQVYDVVPSTSSPAGRIVLLDQAALIGSSSLSPTAESDDTQEPASLIEPQLLPALIDVWQNANPLRQLNWLWQIANLWQSFDTEQVVSSLLSPELIRVEGPLVRLLELRSDGSEAMSLAQLGQLWSQWLPGINSAISSGATALCQQLVQGQFRNAEQLVEQLDAMLLEVGRSQARRIQIATRTDQGPSRQRNEDASYPPAGTIKTQTIRANQTSTTIPDANLVVVCDGIGGHQGGDVASNLAIEAVRQQVQVLNPERLDPPSLTVALERAVCVANDLISQRNDSEQRYDRQRMGTTLVMGLVRAHELYITHVGDSRAYWITRRGCRQVTLDDDVASREVRLGYSPYREALQQPSAGSLVQALGMGASSSLHPTVQRFLLDEDGIFLLCSDGLSDNDRVEEYWETVLLPLLDGKSDVSIASQQLVEIANTRNGHDNVTVGLLYVQVADLQKKTVIPDAQPVGAPTLIQYNQNTALQPNTGVVAAGAGAAVGTDPSTAKTQVVSPRRQAKKPGLLPLLFSIILLLGGGGLLAYSLSLSFRGWVDSVLGLTPAPQPYPPLSTAPLPEPSPTASAPVVESLQAGSFIQVNLAPPLFTDAPAPPVILLRQPQASQLPAEGAGTIPFGSVLRVVSQRATTPQERWVQLQLCSVPAPSDTAPPPPTQSSSPTNLLVSRLGNDRLGSSGVGSYGSHHAAIATSAGAAYLSADHFNAVLAIATAPSNLPLPPAPLQLGASGWVQESQILPLIVSKPTVTPTEQGACLEPEPSPEEAPASTPPATDESPVPGGAG